MNPIVRNLRFDDRRERSPVLARRPPVGLDLPRQSLGLLPRRRAVLREGGPRAPGLRQGRRADAGSARLLRPGGRPRARARAVQRARAPLLSDRGDGEARPGHPGPRLDSARPTSGSSGSPAPSSTSRPCSGTCSCATRACSRAPTPRWTRSGAGTPPKRTSTRRSPTTSSRRPAATTGRASGTMIGATVIFWAKVIEQQARMMHASGILFSAEEWSALGRFLFVEPGGMFPLIRLYFEYFRPGFHPSHIDSSELLDRWRAEYESSPLYAQSAAAGRSVSRSRRRRARARHLAGRLPACRAHVDHAVRVTEVVEHLAQRRLDQRDRVALAVARELGQRLQIECRVARDDRQENARPVSPHDQCLNTGLSGMPMRRATSSAGKCSCPGSYSRSSYATPRVSRSRAAFVFMAAALYAALVLSRPLPEANKRRWPARRARAYRRSHDAPHRRPPDSGLLRLFDLRRSRPPGPRVLRGRRGGAAPEASESLHRGARPPADRVAPEPGALALRGDRQGATRPEAAERRPGRRQRGPCAPRGSQHRRRRRPPLREPGVRPRARHAAGEAPGHDREAGEHRDGVDAVLRDAARGSHQSGGPLCCSRRCASSRCSASSRTAISCGSGSSS